MQPVFDNTLSVPDPKLESNILIGFIVILLSLILMSLMFVKYTQNKKVDNTNPTDSHPQTEGSYIT